MPEQIYYTIRLTNANLVDTNRASDFRLNGKPVPGIRTLAGTGELQFSSEPASRAGPFFGRLIGKQLEFNLAEEGDEGAQCTIRGRISSVATGRAAAGGFPTETISLAFDKITWK